MADYPPAEIIDILLVLGECRENYRAAERLYRERYPDRRHPYAGTIRDLKIRAQNGQLVRVRRHHRYDENDVRVLTVLAAVHVDPHISSRQIERNTGISQRT
ncbi:hypothetical protein EAG_00265, partial [Camponotus floridanus]